LKSNSKALATLGKPYQSVFSEFKINTIKKTVVICRGMAVSLSMMVGRSGSIVGANVAGAMINTACEGMFYLFGGLFIRKCTQLYMRLHKSVKFPIFIPL
jgi:hypothetical protein